MTAAVASSTAAPMTPAAAPAARYRWRSTPSPVAAATPPAAGAAARRTHTIAMAPATIVVAIGFVNATDIAFFDITAAIVADPNAGGHQDEEKAADGTHAP
jgi:hypothetical protein